MRVLRFYVFCLWSRMPEDIANIYGFNLWSAPSFNFWSLVVDATAWGAPSVRRQRGEPVVF